MNPSVLAQYVLRLELDLENARVEIRRLKIAAGESPPDPHQLPLFSAQEYCADCGAVMGCWSCTVCSGVLTVQ